MRHYCTVTDINYLPMALVLYESLVKHSSEPFRLTILAMDDDAYQFLVLSQLPNVWMIPFAAYTDNPFIAKLISTRTHQELCWTMASHLTNTLIANKDEIVYLDADMMFFSDPKQIFDEIGNRSIGIIPHRFSMDNQHLAVNGQFNVSWVSFKNTPLGRECLSRWAAQVREKCSATDGCGDQKYLDEWPSRYGDEVCIIQNPGAGLAPWNYRNWPISIGPLIDGQPIIFFHYHEFKQNQDGTFYLSGYRFTSMTEWLIYDPYIEAYQKAKERIEGLRIQSR